MSEQEPIVEGPPVADQPTAPSQPLTRRQRFLAWFAGAALLVSGIVAGLRERVQERGEYMADEEGMRAAERDRAEQRQHRRGVQRDVSTSRREVILPRWLAVTAGIALVLLGLVLGLVLGGVSAPDAEQTVAAEQTDDGVIIRTGVRTEMSDGSVWLILPTGTEKTALVYIEKDGDREGGVFAYGIGWGAYEIAKWGMAFDLEPAAEDAYRVRVSSLAQ